MAGTHEVGCGAVVIGERAHGIGALLRRNAGGEAVPHVDRHGEGGPERRIVERHHRIEVELLRPLDRERRAHDPRGVADDEGHLLGRAKGRRDEQIALVLAIVIVGDDDQFAAAERGDGVFNGLKGVGIAHSPASTRFRAVCSLRRDSSAKGQDNASPT